MRERATYRRAVKEIIERKRKKLEREKDI